MTALDQQQLGKTLWTIADDLRGAMNADDFRYCMLSFLFLWNLSDNYEAAAKKELGTNYPALEKEDKQSALSIWDGVTIFEIQFNPSSGNGVLTVRMPLHKLIESGVHKLGLSFHYILNF